MPFTHCCSLLWQKNNHSTINNDKPDVVIPLDIQLTIDKHLLIISGPNAGGKSVCLKTVGLFQYMLQCGISIPVSERSTAGTFQNLMIDIGDEQSIENDLSTYSFALNEYEDDDETSR